MLVSKGTKSARTCREHCAALSCVALRCTVLFYGAVACAVLFCAAVGPAVLWFGVVWCEQENSRDHASQKQTLFAVAAALTATVTASDQLSAGCVPSTILVVACAAIA
jgi:hypothetical protein